jgi:hypothetical protein
MRALRRENLIATQPAAAANPRHSFIPEEAHMPRVIHFEIPAEQPERALEFYRAVFGWKAQKWEGAEDYWLLTTGADHEPGINGGLMRRKDPAQPVAHSIDVPSVDEFTAKITEHGGKVVLPKMLIPGVGHLAYCQDTEGNIFGIFQAHPSSQ